MPKTICPRLVNAEAEEIGCGEFALDSLEIGDQVKLLYPISPVAYRPECRVALWVRVTEINWHPHPAYQILTGIVDEVLDLGDTGLKEGQTIRFARCNIVQIA